MNTKPVPVRNTAFFIGLALLFLAGSAMRIFGAWCHRFSPNVDFAITSLMARHMATGQGFPVFFYGQEMMGSLESVPGAILCRLFGCSGFAVCLGTALFGILLLPAVYLWARQAYGRAAGLAAMSFCVIGSPFYFVYLSRTQDYADIVMLGTWIVALMVREVARQREGKALGVVPLFVTGLFAGLGWWSSQLIILSLATAGLLVVTFMGRRLFQPRFLVAFAGAVLGSAPWWIWNLTHDFRSFGLASSFRFSGFREGLVHLFSRTVPSALGFSDASTGIRVSALLILGLSLVAVFAASVRTPAKENDPSFRARHPALVAVPVFFVIAIVIYASTTFGQSGASRYLLPLIPVLAVALGIGTAMLIRTAGGFGVLPLAFLIALQIPTIPAVYKSAARDRATMASARALRDELRPLHVDAVYSDLGDRWLNFALDEEFCFWTLGGLRYEPHWNRIEGAAQPAVLNDAGGIAEFLKTSGGSARRIDVSGYRVDTEFMPPSGGLREILMTGVEAALSDRTFSTARIWDRNDNTQVDIRFDAPRPVTLIRLVFQDHVWPAACRIQGRTEPDGVWRDLTDERKITPYFWSGPRPYWRGEFRRLEIRIPEETLCGIRIVFPAAKRPGTCRLTEAYVYGPAPAPRSEKEGLADGIEWVRASGATRIYCDRWVGARLRAHLGASVQIMGERYTFDRSDAIDPRVRFDPGTVLIVRSEDAPGVRAVLAGRGIRMRETDLAPWILFDFAPDAWREEWRSEQGIRWVGFGCVAAGEGERGG